MNNRICFLCGNCRAFLYLLLQSSPDMALLAPRSVAQMWRTIAGASALCKQLHRFQPKQLLDSRGFALAVQSKTVGLKPSMNRFVGMPTLRSTSPAPSQK